MAYYNQELMSATIGSTTGNVQISLTNGMVPAADLHKAVAFDGTPTDLASPAVKFALAADRIIGTLVGTSNGKLQIAVQGWDVKFRAVGSRAMSVGERIKGTSTPGLVTTDGGSQGFLTSVSNSTPATNEIIRVAIVFGG